MEHFAGSVPREYSTVSSAFFDNAIYIGNGPQLLRIELDGTVNLVADYSSMGVSRLPSQY